MPDVTPFQLSLDTELEVFRPEIRYACQFLERAHGLRLSEDSGPVLHYGSNPPDRSVSVPAVFFPHGVKVSDAGLHPNREAISTLLAESSVPALFPPDNLCGRSLCDNLFGYDALGLIFFLLSRIEERDPPRVDQYGRFPYAESFFHQIGGAGNPWADHAARDIAAKLLKTETPANQSRYGVVLTHDVDRLRGYHKVHLPLRYALGDIAKRGAPLKAVDTLKKGYFGGEPWKSANRIMELSESQGLTSRFFFMGPSRHRMDSTYALDMAPLLKKVTARIAERGHLLGFHPGYDTAGDQSLWMQQKEALENITRVPMTEGRQHVLRYSIDVTPAIWAAAGMKTDYTMTFPEAPGFRTGTCRSFAAYDLNNRQALSVDFTATAITDFGLMGGKYQNLSVEEALIACKPIIEECQKFGGSLCVLFHAANQEARQNMFYESLIEQLP